MSLETSILIEGGGRYHGAELSAFPPYFCVLTGKGSTFTHESTDSPRGCRVIASRGSQCKRGAALSQSECVWRGRGRFAFCHSTKNASISLPCGCRRAKTSAALGTYCTLLHLAHTLLTLSPPVTLQSRFAASELARARPPSATLYSNSRSTQWPTPPVLSGVVAIARARWCGSAR